MIEKQNKSLAQELIDADEKLTSLKQELESIKLSLNDLKGDLGKFSKGIAKLEEMDRKMCICIFARSN